MYIGIYEMDLFEKGFKTFPSLETMQISTYHKKNNDIVELILDLNDLTRYTKIYLVKNRLNTNFPAELIADPRTELIGAAFNNNHYPGYFFDKCTPDTYIYDNYIKLIKETRKIPREEMTRINDLRRAEHFRLYIDGEINCNIPSNYRGYMYDNYLDPENDGLNLINSKNYSIIKLINNIYSDNLELMINWAKQPWNHWENKYILTREISDKEFIDYVKIMNELKVPIHFQIGEYNSGLESKLAFKKWLDRALYCISQKKKLRLYTIKNRYDFYTTLFDYLMYWVNHDTKDIIFYQYILRRNKYLKPTIDTMIKKNPDIGILMRAQPSKLIQSGGIYKYNGTA